MIPALCFLFLRMLLYIEILLFYTSLKNSVTPVLWESVISWLWDFSFFLFCTFIYEPMNTNNINIKWSMTSELIKNNLFLRYIFCITPFFLKLSKNINIIKTQFFFIKLSMTLKVIKDHIRLMKICKKANIMKTQFFH